MKWFVGYCATSEPKSKERNICNVQSDDSAIVFRCEECSFQSLDEDLIQQHEIRHTLGEYITITEVDTAENSSSMIENSPNSSSNKQWILKIDQQRNKNIKSRRSANPNTINSRHLRRNKRLGGPYRCVVCLNQYDRQIDLASHIKKHTAVERKEIINKVLKQSVKNSGTFQPVYQCDKCLYQSKCRDSLEDHKVSSHDPLGLFWCSFCNLLFFHKEDLDEHLLVNHQEKIAGKGQETKTYRCTHCPYTTMFLEYYIRHQNIHHEFVKCENCSFSTDQVEELFNHMTRSHNENYGDPSNSYTTKKEAKPKSKEKLGPPSRETIVRFRCSTCLYITENRHIFVKHLIRHKPDKFKIKDCDADFKKNYFLCRKCNFKTRYAHYLKFHLKRHDREVNIKNISGNENLTEKYIKEDEKPVKIIKSFRCGQCSFVTKYKGYLELHLNKHVPIEDSETMEVGPLGKESILVLNEESNNLLEPCISLNISSTNKEFGVRSEPVENNENKSSEEILSENFNKQEQNSVEISNLLRCDQCSFVTNCEEYLELHRNKHSLLVNLETVENGPSDIENALVLEGSKISPERCLSPSVSATNTKPDAGDEQKNKNKNKSSDDKFAKEIENSVELSNPFHCIQCSFVTNYKKYLKLHMNKHSSVEDLEAIKIGPSNSVNVLVENELEESNNFMEPGIPQIISSNNTEFDAGYNQVENKRIQLGDENLAEMVTINSLLCNLCGFVTKYKKYLELHMNKHSSVRDLGIKEVGLVENRNTLVLEESTKPNESNKPSNLMTTCDLLETRFQELNKEKSDLGIFKCKICNFISRHRRYFDQHLIKHKEPSETENGIEIIKSQEGFKCQNCNFSTNFKIYLKLHLEKHKGSIPAGTTDLISKTVVSDMVCEEEIAIIMEESSEPKANNDGTGLSELPNTLSKSKESCVQEPSVLKTIHQSEIKYNKHRQDRFVSNNFLKSIESVKIENSVLSDDPVAFVTPEQFEINDFMEIKTHFVRFKCNRKNCDYSTNFKEYLKLHLEKPIQNNTNDLTSKSFIPDSACKGEILIIMQGSPEPESTDKGIKLSKSPIVYSENIELWAKGSYNLKTKKEPEIQYEKQTEDNSALNNFRCEICGFETNYNKYIKLHMSKHKKEASEIGNSIINDDLITTFSEGQRENRYDILSNGPFARFKCDKKNCNFTSNFRENFNLHLEIHKKVQTVRGEQQQKVFRCKNCSFTTNFKEYIKLHSKKHEEPQAVLADESDCNVKSEENICMKLLECTENCDVENNCTKHLSCYIKNYSLCSKNEVYSENAEFMTNFNDDLDVQVTSESEVTDISCKSEESREEDFIEDHEVWAEERKHFKCKTCDFVTNFQEYLDLHEQKHLRTDKSCNFRTKVKYYLMQHTKNGSTELSSSYIHHDKELNVNQSLRDVGGFDEYEMDKSNALDANMDELQGSQILQNKDKCLEPQENNCDIKSNARKKFSTFTSKVYKNKTFHCNYCNFKTKFKRYIILHKNKHRLKIQTEMGDASDNVGKLDKPYNCEKCSFSTHLKGVFDIHLEKHATPIEPDIQSSAWAAQYRKPFQYTVLEKCRTYIPNFNCSTCNFKCPSYKKVLIERHKRKHTPDEMKQNNAAVIDTDSKVGLFKCTKCSFKTLLQNIFEVHKLTHDQNILPTGGKDLKNDGLNGVFETTCKNVLTRSEPVQENEVVSSSKTNSSQYVYAFTGNQDDLKLNVEEIKDYIEKVPEVITGL